MYPKRTLIAVGVLAFLGSLSALTPARYLVRLAPESTSRQVADVSGTLWQGQARVATGRGVFNVSWDSHPWRLLMLTVAADWTLAGQGLNAQGDASLSPLGRSLTIASGEVDGSLLGRLTGSRTTFDQPLSLNGVQLVLAGDGRVEEAAGSLGWGPGTLQVSTRPEPLSLPALRGMLRAVDGKLKILVDGEMEPGALLATAEADPVGNQLHLMVTQRGARLAGAAPASASTPDASFFEVKQPLR